MNGKILAVALAALLILVSRLLFAEAKDVFFSEDTAHFALAAENYSIRDDRPHLPGYYLHIQSVRLVNSVTGNSQESMVMLSVVYSVLAGILLFFLFINCFGSNTYAFLLVLAVAFNPLVWLFGSVSESYSFDLFFSAALVLSGMNRRYIYLTPFLMALGEGIRQSSPLLLLPLYLYLWYGQAKDGNIKIWKALAAHAGSVIVLLLWLVPMLNSAGGIDAYINLYKTNNPMPGIGLAKNFVSFASYGAFILVPLILALIPFGKADKESKTADRKVNNIIYICLFWVVPPVLFFMLFHYAKGYYLICAGGIFALAGLLVKRISARPLLNLILIIIAEISIFVFMPYRQPGMQVNFNPAKRNISTARVWTERFLSSYSMSASHINFLNKEKEDFEIEIRLILSFLRDKNKSIILVDPSCGLNARILQARYPSLRFSRLDLKSKDKYEILSGINESVQTGRSNLIACSVIISRKDFFGRYMGRFAETSADLNDYVAFTARQGMEGVVSDAYNNYFSGKK